MKLQAFYDYARGDRFFPEGVIVRFGRTIKVNPERLDEFIRAGGRDLSDGWKRGPARPAEEHRSSPGSAANGREARSSL
jgi:hypothetical protein